jgi:membrane-associated phospholipid phosphatase
MNRYLLICAIVAALGLYAATPAAANDANVMATDILDGVVPLAGLAVAYFKDDTEGQKQWLRNICVNQGLTWALWPIFNQTSLGERPNGDPRNSFPSGHVSLVMSGATFLDRRYGWRWGVPAYVASAYVAYVRVDENKHHWRDVIASAVLSYGVAMLFVTPKNATHLAPIIGPDFIGLRWGRSF